MTTIGSIKHSQWSTNYSSVAMCEWAENTIVSQLLHRICIRVYLQLVYMFYSKWEKIPLYVYIHYNYSTIITVIITVLYFYYYSSYFSHVHTSQSDYGKGAV